MGKNIIQQKRGKGTPTYRAHSFRYVGKISHPKATQQLSGKVIDIINCPGHSAPLALVQYDNKERVLLAASEGLKVGAIVAAGPGAEAKSSNILALKDIPEGTPIFNIESVPGDGGKFVRASGTFAKIVGRVEGKVLVRLPSKKIREFDEHCRACIGIVAGSGRTEKPFLKAGNRLKAARARGKLYPRTSAKAMNAVDHPFGKTRSGKLGRPQTAPAGAPPGRKVGKLRARRTGKPK